MRLISKSLDILLLLKEREMYLSEIERKAGISYAHCYKSMKYFMSRGWIYRRNGKKIKTYYLTDKGKNIIESVEKLKQLIEQ